ncbi:MAG TPA: hypothetical protein VHE09_14920 [Rhizomicrobium sp.]|nr:hypothetical protein [Rhizomicrobium sp.]
MDEAVNYQGLNGEDHRFRRVDMTNLKALPQRGAVVVITKREPEPVYIADAASVRDLFMRTDIWRRAQREYGAQSVYVSASGNNDWCISAARNLRERYRPKMNR